MKGLQITVTQERGVTIASVTGEVDLSNGLHLSDEVLARMPDDSLGLVIDLDALEYIDSAGVRSLFEIAHTLDLRGIRLAIAVREDSPLRSVLKVTRTDEVASLHSDRDAAIAALAG